MGKLSDANVKTTTTRTMMYNLLDYVIRIVLHTIENIYQAKYIQETTS